MKKVRTFITKVRTLFIQYSFPKNRRNGLKKSIPFSDFSSFSVDDSVNHEHSERANAKQIELISCVPAHIIVMNKYRALRKVDKHAEFTKKVQKLTAYGECCCKIQK